MSIAHDLALRIRANVLDYFTGRVGYKTFGVRNRRLWNLVQQAGPAVKRAVTEEVTPKISGHLKKNAH